MESKLHDFLGSPSDTVSREALLRHRLLVDLGVAAAHRGYALQTFLPEVDRNGFDVVIGDGETQRGVQLKARLKGAKTPKWDVQRNLLLPEPTLVEAVGYQPEPYSSGLGGAVVLQEVSVHGDGLALDYFMTDIFVIRSIALGLIPKTAATKLAAKRVHVELASPDSQPDGTEKFERHGMVAVPFGLFLKAKSPETLLGALGLHARGRGGQLSMNFFTTYKANEKESVLRHLVEEWVASNFVP